MVQCMLIYQNAVSLPGHAVLSMQAICYQRINLHTPWQSLALDQLKYLQIAVN